MFGERLNSITTMIIINIQRYVLYVCNRLVGNSNNPNEIMMWVVVFYINFIWKCILSYASINLNFKK